MARRNTFLRSTTALALGAALAGMPLGFATTGWQLFDNQAAYARDGDDSGDNRGPGGGDRDDDGDRGRGGDDGADDDDRGRDRGDDDADDDDIGDDRGRGRGADDGPGDVRGREPEADRGRGIEPGDDRGGDRNRPAFADTNFETQGERVRTFVAIATALGLDPNVGAQQANLGTPLERVVPPDVRLPDGAWRTANLDVNRDGTVNQLDLTAARLGARP